jgi:hypothetical protein
MLHHYSAPTDALCKEIPGLAQDSSVAQNKKWFKEVPEVNMQHGNSTPPSMKIISNPSVSDSPWNHCVQWALYHFTRYIFEIILFTVYPATNEMQAWYCSKKLERLHIKQSSSVSTYYVTGPKKETTVLVVLMLQCVTVTVGTDIHKKNLVLAIHNLNIQPIATYYMN